MDKCPFYNITGSLPAQACLLPEAFRKRKVQAEMDGFKYHHYADRNGWV